MQVRRADQALCHHELTVSSLGSVCQSCTAPLQKHGRSFTSIQMVHTHTHPPAGGWKIKVRTVKWKWNWREMNMRWRWKWDESYLTRTRRGERNAEGKRKTPTQGNLAQHGQTLKRQGKRKAEADGNGKGPAEGGEDGRAWTNLPQQNLRLPQHAQNPTYLERWERRNTWNKGPMGN